jgi:hypothetical protein
VTGRHSVILSLRHSQSIGQSQSRNRTGHIPRFGQSGETTKDDDSKDTGRTCEQPVADLLVCGFREVALFCWSRSLLSDCVPGRSRGLANCLAEVGKRRGRRSCCRLLSCRSSTSTEGIQKRSLANRLVSRLCLVVYALATCECFGSIESWQCTPQRSKYCQRWAHLDCSLKQESGRNEDGTVES